MTPLPAPSLSVMSELLSRCWKPTLLPILQFNTLEWSFSPHFGFSTDQFPWNKLGRVIFLKTCFDFRPDDVVVLNRQLIYREFYPPEYLDELGIKDRKAKSYLEAKRGTSSVSGWSDNSWQQNTCTALWAHFGLGVWKSLE